MNNGALYRSINRPHPPITGASSAGTHSFNEDGGVAGGWRCGTVVSDEEDDSWDDDKDSTTSEALNCRKEFDGAKGHLRAERLRELLATEREYVKDLETLLQLAERSQTTVVQLPAMLSNIEEVVRVAQQLVEGLEETQSGSDQEQQLGQLFLKFSKRLSQVYQEYCSSYSIHVLPLLEKYEESEDAKEELSHLAEDLHSLRPHILSLSTVLIKPVQRILRYPLYLEHLLEDTPSSHPDFPFLQEAHLHLTEAVTQINEYTRGLGLVSKYHLDDDHSLQAKMRRVSLHSLAKKSARVSTLLSQRLGITSQSECIELEEEETKFHSMQSAVVALVSHTKSLLDAVLLRHTSELLVSMGLWDILHTSLYPLHTPFVEAMRQAALESFNQVFKAFEKEITQRVLRPATELATLCEVPARLIQKRHLKKLDYDAAQAKHTVKHESTSSVHTKVCEKQEKVKAYEALQTLLLTELPVLNFNGQMVVITAFHALGAARLYLQGRMARIYLQLTQGDSFPYTTPEAAQETAQKQVEWLLTLLPQNLQKKYISKDPAGTATIRKKNTAKKNRRKSLPAEYLKGPTTTLHPPVNRKTSAFHVPLPQPEAYIALYTYAAEDDTQLTLMPGQKVVPLLKDSSEEWWFVKADSGKKGYVPASYLTPYILD